MAKKTLKEFEIEYAYLKPKLERLENSIIEQLTEIVKENNVSLGFPIQSRVKTFDSINNKVENGRFNLKESITEIQDLVGVRIILMFSKDVDLICRIISENLNVIKNYNTGDKLQDNQFGYSSEHYVVKIPDSWLTIPTLKNLDLCTTEIQIRTVSQHIWAEASNTFQYKQEDNIPREIKRTIGRVSALLETIDLEFDRLLYERQNYFSNLLEDYKNEEIINVDLLSKILDDKLPKQNKDSIQEVYSELLSELIHYKISTVGDLITIIDENYDFAIKEDERMVENAKKEKENYIEDRDRIEKGVFFTHVGIIRTIMHKIFGDDYMNFVNEYYEELE